MPILKRVDDQDFIVGLLSDLFCSRVHSDVKIFHKNREINLHRSVLKSVSEFWKNILSAESEAAEDCVEIILDEVVDFDSCLDIFELAYKGSVTICRENKEKIIGKILYYKMIFFSANICLIFFFMIFLMTIQKAIIEYNSIQYQRNISSGTFQCF